MNPLNLMNPYYQYHPLQFQPINNYQQPQILPIIPAISGLNQPTLLTTAHPQQAQLFNNDNFKLYNAATNDSRIVYNLITPSNNNKIKHKETNYEVIIKSQK